MFTQVLPRGILVYETTFSVETSHGYNIILRSGAIVSLQRRLLCMTAVDRLVSCE